MNCRSNYGPTSSWKRFSRTKTGRGGYKGLTERRILYHPPPDIPHPTLLHAMSGAEHHPADFEFVQGEDLSYSNEHHTSVSNSTCCSPACRPNLLQQKDTNGKCVPQKTHDGSPKHPVCFTGEHDHYPTITQLLGGNCHITGPDDSVLGDAIVKINLHIEVSGPATLIDILMLIGREVVGLSIQGI
jgi:hypothetical protein